MGCDGIQMDSLEESPDNLQEGTMHDASVGVGDDNGTMQDASLGFGDEATQDVSEPIFRAPAARFDEAPYEHIEPWVRTVRLRALGAHLLHRSTAWPPPPSAWLGKRSGPAVAVQVPPKKARPGQPVQQPPSDVDPADIPVPVDLPSDSEAEVTSKSSNTVEVEHAEYGQPSNPVSKNPATSATSKASVNAAIMDKAMKHLTIGFALLQEVRSGI
jgi:hypothetical protein